VLCCVHGRVSIWKLAMACLCRCPNKCIISASLVPSSSFFSSWWSRHKCCTMVAYCTVVDMCGRRGGNSKKGGGSPGLTFVEEQVCHDTAKIPEAKPPRSAPMREPMPKTGDSTSQLPCIGL